GANRTSPDGRRGRGPAAARRRRRASRRKRPTRIRIDPVAHERECGTVGRPPCPWVPRWWCEASSCDEVLLRKGESTIATDGGGRAESCRPGRRGMTIIVPEADGRISQPVLVAQDGKRGGSDYEAARVARRQTHPPRGQHAEEVAVA